MTVNVWDWKSGLKVASNKVSTKVKAISFAENGTYFVTVGNRHVKFWYLDYHRGSKVSIYLFYNVFMKRSVHIILELKLYASLFYSTTLYF